MLEWASVGPNENTGSGYDENGPGMKWAEPMVSIPQHPPEEEAGTGSNQ